MQIIFWKLHAQKSFYLRDAALGKIFLLSGFAIPNSFGLVSSCVACVSKIIDIKLSVVILVTFDCNASRKIQNSNLIKRTNNNLLFVVVWVYIHTIESSLESICKNKQKCLAHHLIISDNTTHTINRLGLLFLSLIVS